MNCKYILIAASLFTALASSQKSKGQVTITRTDMPVNGDTLRYSEAEATSIELDSVRMGGPNRVWQFGTLRPISQGVAQYRLAAQVSPAYGFAFGFNAFGRKVADSVGAGNIQARDVYDFYRSNATAFTAIGRGLNFGGFPLPATFSDPDDIYKFPLSYTDHDSGTFRVVFTVPGVGSWTQAGKRNTEADGWGSITTPFGTFNCLRVKQTVVQYDTLAPDQLPIPISLLTESITYQWLAAGQHYPILEVETQWQFGVELVRAIRYRDINRVILPAFPSASFFSVRRNITTGDSALFFNLSQPAQTLTYNWEITPSAGVRFASGTSAQSPTPIVAFNQAGMYSVKLTATNAAGSDDTLATNYITVTAPSATRPALTQSGWLMPNPASSQVQIQLPGEGWEVRLFDAHGKEAGRNSPLQRQWLMLKGLKPGIYHAYARKGEQVHSQALVVCE